MPLKKTTSSFGCAAYCIAVLFWPLLLVLIFGCVSAALSRGSGFGSGTDPLLAGEGWRAWLVNDGLDWKSRLFLGASLEAIWLFACFKGATARLARRKREQEKQDEQSQPSC